MTALLLAAALLAQPSVLTVGHKINVVHYNDALMSLSNAFVPPSGEPDWGAFPAGSGTNAFLFGDSADECLEGTLQFSHSVEEGSALDCHFHWSPITTATDNVVWQMTYTFAGIGQVFPASTLVFVQDAGDGVADAHQIASFADITCTNCTISTIVLVEICRDGNGTSATDDMAGDVAGHYLDCHEKQNTVGSLNETTK